jgi:hypothetical protein
MNHVEQILKTPGCNEYALRKALKLDNIPEDMIEYLAAQLDAYNDMYWDRQIGYEYDESKEIKMNNRIFEKIYRENKYDDIHDALVSGPSLGIAIKRLLIKGVSQAEIAIHLFRDGLIKDQRNAEEKVRRIANSLKYEEDETGFHVVE